MSKFIKVSGYDEILLAANEIIEIRDERQNGVKIETSSLTYSISQTIEQIEAQLLRDEFAMAAMNGILSNPSVDDLEAKHVAHDAYLFADAMLKERLK